MSRLNKIRSYFENFYLNFRYGKDLESAELYCMFIGYPRSGHSLIGSLLDAHSQIIINHELNVLQKITKGWDEKRIYCEILKNSRQSLKGERMETGYSYRVPHQWQGKFDNLKVIGDKKGGASTKQFQKNPQLDDLLYKTIQKPIKFIHITRNPYDNISSIFKRDGKRLRLDFRDAIDYYFSFCQIIEDLKQKIGQDSIINLKHEDFIDNAKDSLTNLCTFLNLEVSVDYLEDCQSIIFDAPQKSRLKYEWNEDLIQLVDSHIDKFSFLTGYSYRS